MPFVLRETSGDWVSMRALKSMGEVIRLKKGFLESDDNNQYQGEANPRFIVTSTVVSSGDEIKTGVRKGYSRDSQLLDAEQYLNEAPEGTYLDIRFVALKGAYIGLELVGEGVE